MSIVIPTKRINFAPAFGQIIHLQMQITQHNISSVWHRRGYHYRSLSCYYFSGYRSLLEGWYRRYCSCICV